MEENVTETIEAVSASENVVTTTSNHAETLFNLAESSIHLMGFSFILGVVFTIFILLMLDFMRRNKQDDE